MRITLKKAFVLAASLAVSATVGAANVVVSNSDNLTIAIQNGSTVQFDAQGNLILQCQTVSGSDNRCCVVTDTNPCVPLGSGTGDTTPPTAPSSLVATAASDTQINLTWTASTDSGGSGLAGYRVERCTGSTCSVFAEIASPSTNSYSNTGLTASTSYRYRVRAVDGGGLFSSYSAIATATTQAGGGGTGACEVGPNANILPAGFTRVDRTWAQAFTWPNGQQIPTYPNSTGAVTPFGADKGKYTVISFVPNVETTIRMEFSEAQANTLIGYSPARPIGGGGGLYVTVSPCAGDFRAAGDGTDPAALAVCRKFISSGDFFYSSKASASASVCKVTAGVQYYINVIAASPAGGITVGEETCNNGIGFAGCDMMGKHNVSGG